MENNIELGLSDINQHRVGVNLEWLVEHLRFKCYINMQQKSLYQNKEPSNCCVFNMKLIEYCEINWFSL